MGSAPLMDICPYEPLGLFANKCAWLHYYPCRCRTYDGWYKFIRDEGHLELCVWPLAEQTARLAAIDEAPPSPPCTLP
eukprot:6212274-Pleurochrysis_carterae.AAC.2